MANWRRWSPKSRRRAGAGRSLDAREEGEVTEFLQDADAAAPLEVWIFNIGAHVNFPLLETTERVFRKVWEMACYAGFLAGREAARLMLPRGRGKIFFTGATAGMHGGVGYAAFASAKFGLRAVALSAARELGPHNIHVAHLVIDAGVDTAWVRERTKEREGEAALANLDPGRLMRPPRSLRPIGSFIRSRATPGHSRARSDRLRKNGEIMPKVEIHFDFGSPNAYLALW